MKDYDVLNELVPKTQELHRSIFNKGYEQGFNQGYDQGKGQKWIEEQLKTESEMYAKGLNDAWECARKICKMNYETRREALGIDDKHDLLGKIFNTFLASEAIAKIKEYEEKQKQADNEIKVGDEVTYGGFSGKGIVTFVSQGFTYVLWYDGSTGRRRLEDIKKTGRHFDKITEVLKQLKEAEHGTDVKN